jgi:hypothetical protein
LKRVVVISDLHCGHRAGLTPPSYWYSEGGGNTRDNFAKIQRSLWTWFAREVANIGKVDCLVVNGDAVDGKAERSGGAELITADRDEQTDMAAECINLFKAAKVVIIEGTPYHTGKEESWEAVLAEKVDAEHFGEHEWIDVDGVIFDFRHKIGSSQIPHGRFTAPARAALWNALWAERGRQPKANVIVRSHVHYFTSGADSQRRVITTPALQIHSKFGSREIDGTNDIGFIGFTVDKGACSMDTHLCDMRNILVAKAVKI